MMDLEEFKKNAHELVDWIVDYYENIEKLPVKSNVKPGEIYNQLPENPPVNSEEFSKIFHDFQNIILPGITQWQSPNFFAYFPANSSYPSLLGEMLTSAIAAQGMIWDTSPAATELEEQVMNWLKKMIGLPSEFHGVIQDTASTATLVALLSSRERITEYQVNEIGFLTNKYRVYCSSEAHSSVEKAVKIAGFGKQALVKIEVDEELRLKPKMLEECIKNDILEGLIPTCVISAIGTTGTAAIDPLKEISGLCKKYKVWHHIDAAYAGTALILDEYRYMIEGIELADSFVFNPHKWMFTNFDCSAYFVKNKESLIKTFSILPEYLKTNQDNEVNNYKDWGIQLGRRFRALKLWFVIRTFGVSGLKEKIKSHILWASNLAVRIKSDENFHLHEPQNLGVVCFQIKQTGVEDQNIRNEFSKKVLDEVNNSGKVYLSHTKINGEFTFRLVVGQTNTDESHVKEAWQFIRNTCQRLKDEGQANYQ